MRVGGFVLGGACFAAFAGLTIAASAGQAPPTSISRSTAPAAGPRASSNPRLDAFNQPTLDSLNPSSGPTAGGNDVVITAGGGGLAGSTGVDWAGALLPDCGTASPPCFTDTSDTQVTVSAIPPGSAGGVSVDVVTTTGTTAPLTYTYIAAPALTGLSPTSGSTAGGNDVILTGTNFTGATDVHVGSSDLTPCPSAPCFTFDTDSKITVTVPASTPGTFDVNVTTPGGTSGNQSYTYVAPPPPPTLTSLSPTTGFTAGGNDVVLAGTNFTGATSVDFGALNPPLCTTPGFCFSIDTDTQITVHSVPAHAAGSVSVDVGNPSGTSGTLSYFFVTPAPTLTSVVPSSGSTAGGNSVVLGGTNFTGATDVNVGSIDLKPCPSAPCFTVDSDIQITVTMPPSTPGPFNVDVVTLGGTTAGLSYTFVAPIPTVTGVSPNAGAPAGGNKVILAGTDFEAAGSPIVSQVTVGTIPIAPPPCPATPTGPCFTVTSATSITIQLLPAGSGQIHITVTTPGGTSAIASGNVYTYVAVFPNVLTVSPKYGAMTGGAYVAVFGSNFGNPSLGFGATEVDFGASRALPCSGPTNGCFTQIGTTTLVLYTPSSAAGTVDVRVVTPGGTSNVAPPADQYTFVAGGAYTAVNPFRTCDTRKVAPGIASNQCDTAGKGTLGTGHETITAQMPAPLVPAGAQAVVVNITAINRSSGSTYVIAFPAGGAQPVASNISLAGGKVESNLAIVRLGVGVQISLFNAVGSVDVIVDIEGYFAAPAGSAGGFHAIPPLRICDSRGGTLCATATGFISAPLVAGAWRHVTLSGLPPGAASTTPSIPADGSAAAAAFNLTATGGTLPTYLAVAVPTSTDACPTKAPSFSNVNPAPGTSLPIRVISNLGPKQDICLYSAAGKINFLIDNNGWFGKTTAGALFYSVPPTRICDTRPSFGTRCQNQALGANFSELVHVAGIVAVPTWVAQAPKPLAVVANLTAVAGSSATVLTMYPSDLASPPRASDLNPTAGEVIDNLAITSLAQTGTTTIPPGNVKLYNALGSINAILDVAGWFQ
jgi:IPT/TIG domain